MWCALASLGQCLARAKISCASAPQGPKYSLQKKTIWVCPNLHVLLYALHQIHRTCLAERGRNRSRSHIFPIFDILFRSGDIRDQSRKFCKIGQNFACFWTPNFLGEGPPEFLDLDYLTGADSDHVVKFRGDRPRELGAWRSIS